MANHDDPINKDASNDEELPTLDGRTFDTAGTPNSSQSAGASSGDNGPAEIDLSDTQDYVPSNNVDQFNDKPLTTDIEELPEISSWVRS